MTREVGKVITKSRYKTTESSTDFEVNQAHRALVVGGADNPGSRHGLIGKVIESGTTRSLLDHSVWLDMSFPHVIGIFGTRGSGKSFDLGVLAECAAAGEVATGAEFDGGVILFDIQDQFWTLGYSPDENLEEDVAQISDLLDWKLDPSVVSKIALWLPSGCSFPSDNTQEFVISPDLLASEDWLSLLELERYSSLGQALISLLGAFPNTCPAELAQQCVEEQLSSFQSVTVEALRWRLDALGNTKIIGTNGTNIDSLLKINVVSILLLRELSDEQRALVVGVVTRLVGDKMGKIHKAKRISRRTGHAYEEQDLPSRVWLIIDEAHTVVPSQGATAATSPIIDYVKRGRDAGLSLIFATQQPSAVDRKLMSQVDITITHRLGFESDLVAATDRMPTRSNVTYETAGARKVANADLIRSLKTGEAIMADSCSPRTLLVKFRPRISAHGGNTPK